LEIVKGKVKQVVDWTYELVKHDFSTYDLLGQWGREMGAQPTLPGWSLHDRTKTNAEVIRAFYESLRAVAKGQTIIGCNTVGHLAAGLFEAQRTGDDTSGRIWERTRRMGVNTLAYRLPQHNTFFAVDPDCVGITDQIPWELNRQWLDLIARSGAALFVSPGPDATGPEQREALRRAFAVAATAESKGSPTDWFHDTTPARWQFTHPAATEHYDWMSLDGAWPFEV
jgi:alpha-galactosidase